MQVCFLLLIKLLLLFQSINICQTLREHYVGAVVEYKPEGTPWDSTPEELLDKNCKHYKNLIKEAAAQGADIIVFPEYGLTTLGVPRGRNEALPFLQFIPDVGTNPCIEEYEGSYPSQTVRELSCTARESGIYVVVNLGEVRNCSEDKSFVNQTCHPDGRRQYNAIVAFGRDGEIVAKYHKQSLYFEDQFELPPHPEISIFKTDFEVEFGLLICFDMMFEKPAVQLVALGIRNIIYPTAWVDELPFLMAIQSQAIWAGGANVNLLASGYHQPLGGQLGSGIFSGKAGALNYTFDPDSGTRLILAEVPIFPVEAETTQGNFQLKPNRSSIIQYHSYLRENISNYSTTVLDLDYGNFSKTIRACHNGSCCTVEYKLSSDRNVSSTINYRVIAYNGPRKVAMETDQFSWQICGVIRCLNTSLESCTENDQSADAIGFPNFEEIILTGDNFDTSQVMQPAVNALDVFFQEIPFSNFKLRTEGNSSSLTSTSISKVSIQTVAIINRIY